MAAAIKKKTRWYTRVPVKAHGNQLLQDGLCVAIVKDVSAGGMLIEELIEPDIAHNNEIEFEVALPGLSNNIMITGKLVRHENSEGKQLHALQFIHISDFDREQLIKYVAQQQRSKHD